jgi:hypothetical protein
VLHPVGPLPSAVYWRRRLLVLVGTVGVLGGGGWLGVAVATGGEQQPGPVAAAPTQASVAPPALEQVVPSLAAVQVPTPAPTTSAAPGTSAPEPEPDGPVAGGPCTDDMIAVGVHPQTASAPVGGKPTFDLVVVNVSSVPCVRVLDKGLQEIVLLDGAGNRVWGSNDCFPESSSDTRTLQPGESAFFPVVWSGLSSSPGCAAPRVTPGPGDYVLRGRLDTKPSDDASFTLTA